MSYERWLEDGHKVAAVLPPEASNTLERAHYLLDEIGRNGTETDAQLVDYEYLDQPSNDKSFPVVSWESWPQSHPILPGRAMINAHFTAMVIPGQSRNALLLPKYNPQTPLGNGMILQHELAHIDQEVSDTEMYRADTEEKARAYSRSELEQDIGARERDAYGFNLEIIRAADGKAADEYFGKWYADIKTLLNPFTKMEHGAIIFLERKHAWIPRPKHTWFPWEPIPLWHKVHNKVVAKTTPKHNFPKPPKGTFMRDVWAEGGYSRNILHSIGEMAVLERVFDGVLSSEAIDEVAGATFRGRLNS